MALAKAISDLATSLPKTSQVDTGARISAMQNLVKKYGSNFPTHTSSKSSQTTDVVLLTGTTGALGATILAKLVRDPSVEKVYAVNRKGSDGRFLVDRQRKILEDRGLDLAILDSPKVTLIETDLNAENLGLQSDKLAEVNADCRDLFVSAFADPSPHFIRSVHRSLTSSTMVSQDLPFLTSETYKYSHHQQHIG